MEKVTKGTS